MGVLHPNVFYFINKDDWNNNHSYEMWNKGHTKLTMNNDVVSKTIYDPCPVEYSMPKSAAYSYFCLSGNYDTSVSNFNISGVYSNGWDFFCNGWKMGNLLHIYALGLRDTWNTNGNIIGINSDGFYFTSGVKSTTMCINFGERSLYIGAQDSRCRSVGQTILPSK